MFGNASDLGCLGLLAIGKDPATSTRDDWTGRAAKLEEQKPLVRSTTTRATSRRSKSEDTWISMAWSGDIFQAGTSRATTR